MKPALHPAFRPAFRPASRLACCLAALTAGCAAPGPFPSLAQREAERVYAAGDPVAVPPPVADQPEIAARIQALLAAGRGGDAEFSRALAAARPLAARAGAAGGEGWIAAQQAISRAEAARSATVRALADLDAFAVQEAASPPLSDADYRRLTAGTGELQALTARQQAQLAQLRASLSGG